ncbi:hypothetical protein LB526_01485 [Mesorhizobium sp. CA6]|nr:hypothetical protein [Mesorhizobium sp. CA6]MBZ9765436.1 hypothetical protein [Mesorhizobium sp. CA6]
MDRDRQGLIEVALSHFVDGDVVQRLKRFSSHVAQAVQFNPRIGKSLPVSRNFENVPWHSAIVSTSDASAFKFE